MCTVSGTPASAQCASGGLEADGIRYSLPTGVVEGHLHRLAGRQIEERDIWSTGEKARTARNPILPYSPVRLTDKVHRDAVERGNRAGVNAPWRLHGEVRAGSSPLRKSGICKAGRQEHSSGCNRFAHAEITQRADNLLRLRHASVREKVRKGGRARRWSGSGKLAGVPRRRISSSAYSRPRETVTKTSVHSIIVDSPYCLAVSPSRAHPTPLIQIGGSP